MVSREEGEEQVISYLKKHGEKCIKDIAKGIDRSPNFVRTRLSKLEGTGEVSIREELPRKFYKLTEEKTNSVELSVERAKSGLSDTSLQM